MSRAPDALPRPDLYLHVLEEHFEELDFLWEQREGLVFAPDWTLAELAELEARADAHLAGLALGQAHTLELVRPALAGKEWGAATAATLALLALDADAARREVIDALSGAEGEALEGLRLGLRHGPLAALEQPLSDASSRGGPSLRLAALDVLAFQRRLGALRPDELPTTDDAEESALAFRILARTGTRIPHETISAQLQQADAALGRAALEAAALGGDPGLPGLCRELAGQRENAPGEALAFLGVVGPADASGLLRGALADPALAAAALRGLGALGLPETIPDLIEAMGEESRASQAAAAFVRIVGAVALWPPGAREDEQPPDADLARAAWAARRATLRDGTRYQAGGVAPASVADPAFDALPLESRRDAYLRLRVEDPAHTPDLELEARALCQRVGGPA
jgi:uncharacterized protein (TIGR02270 family)